MESLTSKISTTTYFLHLRDMLESNIHPSYACPLGTNKPGFDFYFADGPKGTFFTVYSPICCYKCIGFLELDPDPKYGPEPVCPCHQLPSCTEAVAHAWVKVRAFEKLIHRRF